MRNIFHNWFKETSIQSRLVSITVIPVLVLLIFLISFTSHVRKQEGETELANVGKIYAESLALNSEYAVFSGNLEDLQREARKLLISNKSIKAISILNSRGVPLVNVNSNILTGENLRIYSSPIIRKSVPIDTFSELETTSTDEAIANKKDDVQIGLVQVSLSSTEMFKKVEQQNLYISALIALALIFTTVLILILSKKLTRPIHDAIEIIKGNHPSDRPIELVVSEVGEIGDLQTAINKMSKNLWEATQVLESKVKLRTQELQDEKDKVSLSNIEKRNLIKKQNSLVEEERRKIAMDIHDHLNAVHIGIKLETQRILKISSGAVIPASFELIQGHATSVINQTIDLIDISRQIVKRLRPEMIDVLGLKDSLDEMCRQYNEISASTSFQFKSNGNLKPLNIDLSICAYRLVQEALSNVIKHSNALECKVTVSLESDILTLEIEDNGTGFDLTMKRNGIGMVGMEERAYAFHGKLQIDSSDRGTILRAIFPDASGEILK